MTERRRFIVATGGVVAATATAIVDAPNVIAQPKIQWRMSTAWARGLRRLQTGFVMNYALTMLVGAVAIVAYLLARSTR